MCGIFGIVSTESVARKITLGLYDLQHRGEQAVGVAVSSGTEIHDHREEGLVTEVFGEKHRERLLGELSGLCGIGHVLYSTIGKAGEAKQPRTFQPLIGDFHGQPFALGHNGNLIELDQLRLECERKGYQFQSPVSDTEVIVALLSTSDETNFLEALGRVLPRLKGAFALTILCRDKVIGVRDRFGIRPLCLGRDETSFMLASEECAFHTMGADFIREIGPAEIIVLGKNGIERSFLWLDNPCLRLCVFEFVYFARPDSRLAGTRVNAYRNRAGETVAKEHPVEADIVCPVPFSGEIYDLAVARVLGIPAARAIVRNRYFSRRTFMSPRETDRRALQRIKFYPLREVVHDLRVVMTEDSIVRANASPEVVAMLREAGAIEVHVRVGSSPIRYPCFLGMDFPTRVELAAAGLTVEELGRRVVKADSLGYISWEGMAQASGLPKESLCMGCFTGEYPVESPGNCNEKPSCF